jgi:Dullard-like phosphatase family protein
MVFISLWFWFLKLFCCHHRPSPKSEKRIHQKFQLFKPISTKNLNRKKMLVLDLDETLIHSSLKKLKKYDFTISMYIDNRVSTFYVAERPHLHKFMEEVSKWYHVVIFTASLKNYADLVIDKVDKKNKILKRYYRESCEPILGGQQYIKDLSVLKTDLSRCIIVDNSEVSFSKNKENGIPILSYMGQDSDDKELLHLLTLLEALRHVSDVRSILSLRL